MWPFRRRRIADLTLIRRREAHLTPVKCHIYTSRQNVDIYTYKSDSPDKRGGREDEKGWEAV